MVSLIRVILNKNNRTKRIIASPLIKLETIVLDIQGLELWIIFDRHPSKRGIPTSKESDIFKKIAENNINRSL